MWETGAIDENKLPLYYLHFLFKDGSRKDFEAVNANQKIVDKIYQEADDYLDSL